MKDTWDSRIRRAEYLAAKNEPASELLAFYAKLLGAQKDVYEYLRARRGWLPTGVLEQDLAELRAPLPGLLRTVEKFGPPALAADAQALLRAPEAEIDEMLLRQWREPSDIQFFAKAFLQPYARWLAETEARPIDRPVDVGEALCPFCGGKPQLSYLQTGDSSSEAGIRKLFCATCVTPWTFRRVVCANCLEERPAQLGYFQSPEYDHVRVEACDTCHHYLKGVDLTRLGLAIPLVDEIAAAALDVWAREHGYTKIELNLVGL